MKKIFALFVSGMAMASMVSFAQDTVDKGKEGKRWMSPAFTALDANGDGVIDEKEIADAPQNLKKLDKNADGKISADELRPQRTDAAADSDKKPEGGKKFGEGKGMKHPVSPLIATIDANGDGVIDEKEIVGSSEALKKLDKNADGKITSDEIRPPAPEGFKRNEGGKKTDNAGVNAPAEK